MLKLVYFFNLNVMKTVLLLNDQIYCLIIRLKQLYFIVERAIVGIGFRMI